MTPEEIKAAITRWCSQGSGLQLVEDRSEPGADFALGLRAPTAGAGGSVPVDVRMDSGSERVTVSSPTGSAQAGQQLASTLEGRPASVRAETRDGATVIASHVYADGFNRHSFTQAVEEVAKTRSLLGGMAAGAGAVATGGGAVAGGAALESQPRQEAWSQPAAQSPQSQGATQGQSGQWYGGSPTPLPSPSFGGAQSQPSPLSGQAAQPQSQPSSPAFAPTHTVPPQGMQAWAAPDPNGAVVATLGGGLPIQVTEVRGAWARVLCSNGWTGWVDGRIIGVAR